MSIDPDTETIITLGEACRLVPPRGISTACMARWIVTGVRGAVLETIRIGGRRLTSREALGRFFAAQNRDQTPVAVISPKQRRRQAETADRQLQEAGIWKRSKPRRRIVAAR